MGFPRNLEKQDFIQLRLEQDPRPGGRSKANARKYYGGVYHRTAPDVRKQVVDEWKKGKKGGEEEDADGGEDSTTAKGEVEESAGTTESAQLGGEATFEARQDDGASAAPVASDQPANDQELRSTESNDQQDDAAPENNAQPDAQPSPIANTYHATSTAIEQHDETTQVDDEEYNAPPTELSPAPTSSDAIPAADEDSEEAGEKKQDARADSVQPSSPQQPSAATNANPRDQDAAPAPEGTRQDSQNASAQQDEQPTPAVEIPPAEDSGVNNQPFEEDDDAALTSLEQEIEKALGGVHKEVAAEFPPRHSSIAANAASMPSQDSGEQAQDRDETDSLFVGENGDGDSGERPINEVTSSQGPRDAPPEENQEDNTAQVSSQQQQDLDAEFSADEGDDSDPDDLLGLQDSDDDDDDDEANINDLNAEQQQDQEGLDFWPSSSNNYGAGGGNSFLPDDMLSDTNLIVQPGPTLNAPEVPSMSSSAAQSDNEAGSSEKKRKLSDGLSTLSPEVRAAFLDSTEGQGQGQGQGQSRYIGIGTPDGPPQKKPRLNVRRPGQQGSTQPSPQEEQSTQSPQQPAPASSSLSGQPTAETLTISISAPPAPPETVGQETEILADKPAKPSFLSSILNETKTKPLYPGSRY